MGVKSTNSHKQNIRLLAYHEKILVFRKFSIRKAATSVNNCRMVKEKRLKSLFPLPLPSTYSTQSHSVSPPFHNCRITSGLGCCLFLVPKGLHG
jgi:hypothetical protein